MSYVGLLVPHLTNIPNSMISDLSPSLLATESAPLEWNLTWFEAIKRLGINYGN